MPSSKLSVAVLISGRGSNLEALLKAALAADAQFEIGVVLSDREDARGLEVARSYCIATMVVARDAKSQSAAEYNLALADALAPYKPQLVVLAGFMRVLRPEFISRFNDRIINIHPSLLPSFPGLEAQRQALEAGVRFTGCTVHFVTAEVDAGPIIAQSVVAVLPNDTVESLTKRILREEHQLLPGVVQAIGKGEVVLRESAGRRTAHVAPLSTSLTGAESISSLAGITRER